MPDLLSLASTGLAFFVVAVSPGPANISNAAIAMNHGRKISLVYGAGLSCGLIFWGLIAASGMGAVLQGSHYLLMVLKLLGGLYLLWLAFLSSRAAASSKHTDSTPVTAGKRWFLRGWLLNLSNPKSVIAWMAALSVGINTDDGLITVVTATIICSLLGILNNLLCSILFSIDGMMRGYQHFKRRIDASVAVLFALGGLGLIRSAFSR